MYIIDIKLLTRTFWDSGFILDNARRIFYDVDVVISIGGLALWLIWIVGIPFAEFPLTLS